MTQRVAYLVLGVVVFSSSGCVAILAGAGVVGGCCGAAYVYAKGKLCGAYPITEENAWVATRAALADLAMPVTAEDRAAGYLDSHTTDGTRVRIFIGPRPSRIPAEGVVTDICVRVGVFGDRPASERILRQIATHIAPPRVPCPGAANLPMSQPLVPVPANAPPSAPAAGVPGR